MSTKLDLKGTVAADAPVGVGNPNLQGRQNPAAPPPFSSSDQFLCRAWFLAKLIVALQSPVRILRVVFWRRIQMNVTAHSVPE